MSRKLIIPALVAPAIILSPAGAVALEKAGFLKPSIALEKRLPLNMVARTRRVSRPTPNVAPFTVEYLGGDQTATNGTSWAPSGVNLGAPAADRDFLIAIGSRASFTGFVDDVRIGVASNMTMIKESSTTGNGGVQFWLTNAYFPTGTSQTLNIGASGTMVNFSYDIWRITGLTSRTPRSTADTTTDAAAMTLGTFPDGAVAFGASSQGGTSTCTVTGATELNDRTIEAGSLSVAVAQGSANSMTFDWTTATNVRSIAIALL